MPQAASQAQLADAARELRARSEGREASARGSHVPGDGEMVASGGWANRELSASMREEVAFADQAEFETWLEQNHATNAGLWLAIAKKGTGSSSVTYEQAVEVALCFGWIDGQKARGDGRFWLQRFTPRKPRSPWSRINREKAERLIEAGRMRAAGLAEVERAKADGRWERAYAGAATAEVPPELKSEFEQDPAVAAAFERLSASSRYSIIWRINDARRPETRARRVAEYLDSLRRGSAS